jgi:hypothetical protein
MESMTMRKMLVSALMLMLALQPAAFAAPKAEPSPSEFPWELRVHYSFPINDVIIDYDEAYSRIRVRQAGKVLANDLYFAIQFADGTTWDYRNLPSAKTVRQQTSDPVLGHGTSYTTTYPSKDNLEVRYILTAYDSRPFTTLQVEVQNHGTDDVRISALDPLITGPGGISGLPQATHRQFTARAGYPVFDKGSAPYVTVLKDPASNATFAIGLVPEGIAESGIRLEQQGGAWHGRVESRFRPSLKLSPGQTLASDRVAIAHGAPLKADIELYYAWAFSSITPPKDNRKGPVAWVSVAGTQGLDALVSAVNQWDGIKHALIPANWEGRPGSLKGGGGWPANIGSAASALRSAGAMPGITVDPLAADGAPGAASVQSPDGQQWVNPAIPAGQDYIRKRIARLAGDGFAFFAVAPSAIPDAALEAFGISRGQANTLAIDLVEEAVGERPVYAAAGQAVGASPAEWAEVATAFAKFSDYTKGMGPVRLNAEGLGQLDPATAEAIRNCPAPIEVIGRPSAGGAKSLAAALKAQPDTKSRAEAQPKAEGKKKGRKKSGK